MVEFLPEQGIVCVLAEQVDETGSWLGRYMAEDILPVLY